MLSRSIGEAIHVRDPSEKEPLREQNPEVRLRGENGRAEMEELGKHMDPGDLIAIVKAIVRKAALLSIDEAGAIILGPAWPYLEPVIQPVLKELEERFPELPVLAQTPRAEALKIVEDILTALETDFELQSLLGTYCI